MTPCKRLKGFTALIREIIFNRVIARSVLEIRNLNITHVLTSSNIIIASLTNNWQI